MTDATKPYTNNTTQVERTEALLNDRRVQRANTYAGRANAELGLEQQGRHATKSIFDQSMPTLPADHWSNQTNAIPPEEPLGIDVNAVEPQGEPHEVAASLRALGVGDAVVDPAGTEPHSSLSATVEQPAAPGDAAQTNQDQQPPIAQSRALSASPPIPTIKRRSQR